MTTAVVWKLFLSMTAFLDIFSVACVQASSPVKPQHALFSMLLAFLALLAYISAIICKGRMERVEFRRWWFTESLVVLSTPLSHAFCYWNWHIFAVLSCICTFICLTVPYVCYINRHVVNPLKPTLYSGIIIIYLYASTAYEKRIEMRVAQNTRIQNIEEYPRVDA